MPWLRPLGSAILFLLKAMLVIGLSLVVLIAACSYNPYRFEEYELNQIALDGRTVSRGSAQHSVEINGVAVSVGVYMRESGTWEKDEVGGPYRMSFHFAQGCDDPSKWHRDVLVAALEIQQNGRSIVLEGFPETLTFKERPTVPGTPRQNGAGRMINEMHELDFSKNVSIRISFQVPAEGQRHEAEFEFRPNLREGIFRNILVI